jgi:hypothetical protein
LAKRALVAHSDGPKPDFAVACKISRMGKDGFKLEYVVIGEITALRLPPIDLPDRADGLWNSTCFEAFFANGNGSYIELNFAPSRKWASYRFESYRDGMAPAHDMLAPDIFTEPSEHRLTLTAFIEFPANEASAFQSVGLSAVIEETDGTKSYWALAHPPGKPDFHHPTCFALTLPPPSDT